MRWTSASAWSSSRAGACTGAIPSVATRWTTGTAISPETGDGHQLSAQVMERVRFQSGNLFDAGLLAHAPAYDFVFCRNLLIYFDQATQERAVQVLRRVTRARMACCSWARPKPACSRRAGCRRWRCRIASPSWRGAPMRRRPLPPLFKPRPCRRSRHRASPRRARPRRSDPCPIRPALQPPAAPVVAVAAKSESEAEISLRQIEALADQGRVKDAIALRRAPGTLWRERRRFICKACCRDAAGDARQAQAAYRKVLYLQPNHREALLHLAALVASEGDHESARRLQARARQEARRD